MSEAIWLIAYDVAANDQAQYLSWFHDVHIPEKLARPGYTWAAHYELVTTDGKPALLSSSTPTNGTRGFLALFGGEDTRTFLNPSPAQIKPTQPPLTREMMGLRIGSQTLIASEEWQQSAEQSRETEFVFLDVTICDAGPNDENYGAWCIQSLHPHLAATPGFETMSKLLSTTAAAKHLTIASFSSLEAIKSQRASSPTDDWSTRVRDYQKHSPGSPMIGRRIWPDR